MSQEGGRGGREREREGEGGGGGGGGGGEREREGERREGREREGERECVCERERERGGREGGKGEGGREGGGAVLHFLFITCPMMSYSSLHSLSLVYTLQSLAPQPKVVVCTKQVYIYAPTTCS